MSLNGANGSNGLAAGGQSPEYIVPLQINGEEITTDNTFDVVSPRTGKLLWKSASCSKKDAIRAVEAAQAAFPNWSRTKPAKRRDLLLKAAELFESRAEELAELMDTETGSPPALSKGFNLPTTIELIRDVAGRIATIQGSVPICAEEGTSAIVYKEPYGVILGIAPWYNTKTAFTEACSLTDCSQERSLYSGRSSGIICTGRWQYYYSQSFRAVTSLLLCYWPRFQRRRYSRWLSQCPCSPASRCCRGDYGPHRASIC